MTDPGIGMSATGAISAATSNESQPDSRTRPLCVLCGTPVPFGMRRKRGKKARYCCSGCLNVAEILKRVPAEQGLKLLAQARRLGIVPREGGLVEQAQDAERVCLAETRKRANIPDEAFRNERFMVEGYACPSCAWLTSAALLQLPGVVEADADFLSDSVRVRYDMRRTGPDEMMELLRRFGYGLEALRDEQHPEEALFSRLLTRFAFALFLALNVMMLSAVHWASWMELIPLVDLKTVALIQLVLCIPLFALGVWPLIQRSWQLLRLGRSSMDLLFVIGFFAAFGLSVAAFFPQSGYRHFYFDSCAAFVAISLFGRLVEGKLRLRSAAELRGLLRIGATKVQVSQPDGNLVYRALPRILPGERIRVGARQFIPLDGECLEPVLVSEALLTGEPTPVRKLPGDLILAGVQVLDEEAWLRVSRPYQEGRLRQIADGVAAALTRNELRLRSADRLAAWFVPLVIALAVMTWLARTWMPATSGSSVASIWMPTIAVLLVACPCAFGIATAAAMAVAISALLKNGVLIKDAGALERLMTVNKLVLDKTGTLTTGSWQIKGLHWFQETDEELLRAVAGAERNSDHPVAHALLGKLIGEFQLDPLQPDAVQEVAGRGIQARFGVKTLSIGNRSLFGNHLLPPGADDMTSLVYFGFDGRLAGCFLLGDTVRPGMQELMTHFRSEGFRIEILSGDRQAVVQALAGKLGIVDARGELSPEDKRAWVEKSSMNGERVLLVGDGSNDALAMAEADVSMGLRHGTDLSLSAAQILPLSGDLSALPAVLRAARVTVSVLHRNFLWAFGYNAVFLPLAALGYLHPVFAAGLMFASSTTVLISSLRLRPAIARVFQTVPSGEDT